MVAGDAAIPEPGVVRAGAAGFLAGSDMVQACLEYVMELGYSYRVGLELGWYTESKFYVIDRGRVCL